MHTALKVKTSLLTFWYSAVLRIGREVAQLGFGRRRKAVPIKAKWLRSTLVQKSGLDANPIASGMLAGLGGGRRFEIAFEDVPTEVLARHMRDVLTNVSRASVKYATNELSEAQRKDIVQRRIEMLRGHKIVQERLDQANVRMEKSSSPKLGLDAKARGRIEESKSYQSKMHSKDVLYAR
jgi:hypothetical protein